ncbi:MAG: LuxR C-terminal-related transcriptional regulator [Candidatus Azobacteroides sp.]|nr:LuxR C-terminal-related transcriptional regulator [Candidatus Azobacteroides sp.]
MSKNKSILILTTDFLQGYGLKQLLEEYHYMENFTYSINPKKAESGFSKYDLIFISSDFYFSLYDNLIPIKKKVILLTTISVHIPEFTTLNINNEEELFPENLYELCSLKLNRTESQQSTKMKTELSEREKEVLALVGKGYMNKNIADELNISINTVLTHRKNLTAKLGIKTVSGMTMYAILNGLISADDIQ